MKIFFIGLAAGLAASAFLAGCGGKNGAGSGTAGKDLPPEMFGGALTGEITVSAYDTLDYRSFLEEAVRDFESKNPGTKINVETFSAMPEIRTGGTGNTQMVMVQVQDDPQGRADYISRVNTALMSGTGADLYAMDVLPLHRLAVNGALENLEPWMAADPDFNRSDYRQNILDALHYRNGTWFLPLTYSFKYYAYDAVLVPPAEAARFGPDRAWNAGELLAMGEQLYSGDYRIFNAAVSSLGLQMLNERYDRFVDQENKRANFLDGGFTALLNSLRLYEEKGYIPPEVKAGQRNAGEAMLSAAASAPTDRFFFKLNNNASLFTRFSQGTGIQIRMEGGVRAVTDDDEIAGIAARADGAVSFDYSKAFGVNAQSGNKALSWAFLRYLLSKESQLSTAHRPGNLPLHNEARRENAELVFSGSIMGRGGQPLTDLMKERIEQYRTAVETLSDQINNFTVRDSAVDGMIQAETRYFLEGSRSAEETAKVLQNKAELYLSE